MADYTALCGSCTTGEREEYDYLLTYKNTNHIDHIDHKAMLERGLGVSGFLSYRSQMALTAHNRGQIAAEALTRPQTACYMENQVAPRANNGRSSRAPYWLCNRTHNPATGSLASASTLPLRQRAEVQFAASTVSATVLSADHRSQPVDSTCLLPAGPQIIGLLSPPWRRDAGSIGPNDSSRHIRRRFKTHPGVPVPVGAPFLSPVSHTSMAASTRSKNLYEFLKVPSPPPKNGKEKFPMDADDDHALATLLEDNSLAEERAIRALTKAFTQSNTYPTSRQFKLRLKNAELRLADVRLLNRQRLDAYLTKSHNPTPSR